MANQNGKKEGSIPWPIALFIGIAIIGALLYYGEKTGDPAFSFSTGEKASYTEEPPRDEEVLFENGFLRIAIEE